MSWSQFRVSLIGHSSFEFFVLLSAHVLLLPHSPVMFSKAIPWLFKHLGGIVLRRSPQEKETQGSHPGQFIPVTL